MDFRFKYPTLKVQDLLRKANTPKDKETLRKYIVENNMLTIYNQLISQNVLQENKQDINKIKEQQESSLRTLYKEKEKQADNVSVIKSIDIKIAELHAQFMNTDECLDLMQDILRDEPSMNLQIDIYLCKIRIAFLLKNRKMLEESVKHARSVSEHGCDWDRKNKFTIYDAIYKLKKCQFKDTAVLLSKVLTSFEENEVVEFKDAVEVLVFTGLLTMTRADISKCLLMCPDVHKVGRPETLELIKSLYECRYNDYLPNLYKYLVFVRENTFLCKYSDYFCKEMKFRGYKQLLDSYRSINLQNMCSIFGVELEYLENDLQVCIAENKLNVKIDKVTNTIDRHDESLDGHEKFVRGMECILEMINERIE